MAGRATAFLGILALTTSCGREPAAPAVPSDATFSASDPRCTFSQQSWAISTTQVAATLTSAARAGAGKDRIRLDAKSLLTWNGMPVDRLGLRQFLDASDIVMPQPVIIVQADRRASCGALRAVIADAEKVGHCAASFCLLGWAAIPADPNRGPLVFLPTHAL